MAVSLDENPAGVVNANDHARDIFDEWVSSGEKPSGVVNYQYYFVKVWSRKS